MAKRAREIVGDIKRDERLRLEVLSLLAGDEDALEALLRSAGAAGLMVTIGRVAESAIETTDEGPIPWEVATTQLDRKVRT